MSAGIPNHLDLSFVVSIAGRCARHKEPSTDERKAEKMRLAGDI